MRLAKLLLLSCLTPALAGAAESAQAPDEMIETAAALRERALADDTAWKLVESLTTEIGPRLAGSEADARAVAWAQAKFRELGYDRVWTEPVTFPKWERRSESAQVLGIHAQPLVVTALGGSPGGTVDAEIVRFDSLEALQAAPAGSLSGRIAFVDYRMQRARDGSSYGKGGAIRSRGPSEAIRKGAVAFLMRSASTSAHRVTNTGITRFDAGLEPIPSAALSLPDADQLVRLLQRSPVRVRLALDCGWDGEYTSHNVIGEITGREAPQEVVLLGAHLDSWDLGTGAIDDASGIGISMAAGRLVGQLPQRPRRSIRVVAFANEEQGLLGGREYARRHAADVANHVIAVESDFGAGRIYGFNTSGGDAQAVARIAEALAPLGIARMPGKGGPGPDISPLAAIGGAWAWLGQDGTHYFDLHHNADDTLDKIDPADLAQNLAAYAVFAWLAAESDDGFGSAPKPGPGAGE